MKKDYNEWSKDQLIERIKQLENELTIMLDKKNKAFLVNFPWAGNLGEWHWYYDQNKVIFNEKKVTQIGYDIEEVGEVGFEFFTNKLHPDDYERVMQNMRAHLIGKTDAYEVEYRIQHKEGHYLWYYDRGVVTKRDSENKPLILQGIVFDITASKKIEDKLRHLSKHDELTDLYNRRELYTTLEQLIKAYHLNGTPFSLIMFDIDHFKKINDKYGHLVGDNVLKHLADFIKEDKRAKDEIYRYGGEEFILTLPVTAIDGALNTASRFHEKIQQLEVPKVGNFTISMGVVEYKENETIDDVIKRVDKLMYEAKEAGRNCYKY